MSTRRRRADRVPPSELAAACAWPTTSAIIKRQVKLGHSRRSATQQEEGGVLFVWPRNTKGAPVYGPRNGEVVQRREGLRLYLPGRRGRGPLRAPHGYSRQRLQVPRG